LQGGRIGQGFKRGAQSSKAGLRACLFSGRVKTIAEKLATVWPSSKLYQHKPTIGNVILEAHDIVVEFGGIRAVDGASIVLRRGELVGLIGPNGAGKTSLLNVISGFYKPVRGRVIYKGMDITKLPPHERAKLGIARTFQHSELFKHMTVIENIMVGLEPWRKYTVFEAAIWLGRAKSWEEWAMERAELIVDLLDLHQYRDKVVGSLPPGIQKRVDLARALVQNPEVVLMDEPMAGLSREEKEDLARAIVEVNETQGVTFLLVEHDLEAVMDLCSRVIVMDSGRIIAEGTPEEVASNPRVIAAYMGA
jgi:branched-chain amino acid transport system ATP-binding protein